MISKRQVMRLIRYKNSLKRLKVLGVDRVYSSNIADIVNVKPTQVRKDFSIFNIYGSKKGGYRINSLIEQIQSIIGKNVLQEVIVVGCGRIGRALIGYKGIETESIKIVAGFDNNHKKVGKFENTSILPYSGMAAYIRENNIKIGIISVSMNSAQSVLDSMVYAGIEGVLNFVPTQLIVPGNCHINNVNFAAELETLFYFVNKDQEDEKNL